MKKVILSSVLLALIISLVSCKGKKEGFTLSGTITGADTAWVLLKKREDGKWITKDSTRVAEGKFSFTGTVEMPEMNYLAIKDKEGFLPFFLENAEINMTVYADSLDKSTVTGSATHDLYATFLKQDELYNKKMEELYAEYMKAKEANDSVKALSMEGGFDAIQKEQTKALKDFILKNSKSVVAAYLTLSNAYNFELAELQEINKALDPSISKSSYVMKLKEREETLLKVQPGNPAPEFALNDSTGKAISLSSFRGKVVLVDFWASWCGPCRAENPNVVKAYNTYSGKNFTVFGVSLDSSRERWLEAIKEDGLTWSHVSELQGWKCSAAQLYGVMSIPSNFLIDKEGKIIASNLRGEDLLKKLEETLAEPVAAK